MNKKIIKLKDYTKEYVYYSHDDRVDDTEDLRDIIEEQLTEGKEPKIYAHGYTTEIVGDLNIEDALRDSHYDEGYEGIEDRLYFGSDKLKEAQRLVDEWLKDNEYDRTCYSENENELIDLSELIEEVRAELEGNTLRRLQDTLDFENIGSE